MKCLEIPVVISNIVHKLVDTCTTWHDKFVYNQIKRKDCIRIANSVNNVRVNAHNGQRTPDEYC